MTKKYKLNLVRSLAALFSVLVFCSLLFLDLPFAWAASVDQGAGNVEPLDPPWPSDAIVALNDGPCGGGNGASFGGSGDTIIYDGGIFTNGCLSGNGNNFDVIVENGYVRYVGDFHGSNNFDPDPEQVNIPIMVFVDLVEVIQAECDKLPSHPARSPIRSSIQTILYPGNYLGSNFIVGDTELKPGLYCVTGNIAIDAGEQVTGAEVTIFLTGGSVWISGGTSLNLSAPRQEIGPLNIFTHLLFYVTEGNVTWNSGSEHQAVGRVYAPQGKITLSGNSAQGVTQLNIQLVGWNVEVTGNSTINILPGFLDDPLPFVE
jgi:hypothetical protein